MRITKFGHACVRIEHDGTTVVLDPGVFTQAEAVDGADAVLITHEHFDHMVVDHLRATDAPIFTIAAVEAAIRGDAPDVAERVTIVSPGDALTEPGEAVDVLLVPSSAPWLKASEAVDFARAVKAPRNLAIHDRIYTDAAHGILENHMNAFLPKEGMEYLRRADGQDL